MVSRCFGGDLGDVLGRLFGRCIGRVGDFLSGDLGRVFEDFWRVLRGFLDYFSHFYRKSRFCKK